MTSEEIRKTVFEQTRKGYRTEDVDDYLIQVAAQMDDVMAECNAVKAENERLQNEYYSLKQQFDGQISDKLAAAVAAKEDAEAKMYVLAEKVEEYRGQEDNLKNALINAQRMGETVVHEAKLKADQMLREAAGQTELLTQKAEREIVSERATLERILGEVNHFKTTILNLYKQHIESLSALDPPTNRAQEILEETERYREKAAAAEALTPFATSGADAAKPAVAEEAVGVQPPTILPEAEAPPAPAQMPTINAAPAYEPVAAPGPAMEAPVFVPPPANIL